MSSTIRILEDAKLKYKDILDFDEFYKKMALWFKLKGYTFAETQYNEFDDPRGKQIELIWETNKKFDVYAKFLIKIQTRILAFNKIEIEKEGKKVKTSKGDFSFRINTFVVLDYDNNFDSGFKKILREIYDRFVIQSRIENYKISMQKDSEELLSEMKSFFAMFGSTPQYYENQ
mgnify:CR=1 FL=1